MKALKKKIIKQNIPINNLSQQLGIAPQKFSSNFINVKKNKLFQLNYNHTIIIDFNINNLVAIFS